MQIVCKICHCNFPTFSAISDLVSVTEDVWSVATKHVNVLLPVQIPNFAAGGASIKLKKQFKSWFNLKTSMKVHLHSLKRSIIFFIQHFTSLFGAFLSKPKKEALRGELSTLCHIWQLLGLDVCLLLGLRWCHQLWSFSNLEQLLCGDCVALG